MQAGFSLMLVFVGVPLLGHAAWSPPANPDPQKIEQEAAASVTELKFAEAMQPFGAVVDEQKKADALARFVWFEQNGVRLQPTLMGVRDSFAVDSWRQLAALYPPALDQLRAARGRAADRVRDGDGVRDAFLELAAINRELGQRAATMDLFMWLDANRPERARQVFSIVESALVEGKRYALCGKYREPEKTLRFQTNFYRASLHVDNAGEQNMAAARDYYENGTATLVGLLALNDRKDEAADIAARALEVVDSADYRAQLDKALTGQLPPPYPSGI